MLTFAIYHLLKTPAALRKVRAEIDAVIGDRPAQTDDLSNMPYLTGSHIPPPSCVLTQNIY
jgi:cytochrome P450/NADPH-cytochrome P450 reductase